MNTANYSPAKEFLNEWWTGRIKPFLNFKQYLAQRSEILSRPEVILEVKPLDDKKWRSPLQFALQGAMIPALVLSLLTAAYFFFIAAEPQTDWKGKLAKDSEMIQALKAAEKQLEGLPSNARRRFFDEPDHELTRDDALQEVRRRIQKREGARWILNAGPHVEAAQRKFQNLLGPMTLILGAYFFKTFLRTGQGRKAVNLERAHEVYLYFVTSSVFWLGLLQSICIGLMVLGARTGKGGIVSLSYNCLGVLGLITLILVHNECKKLSVFFGMPLLEGKGRKRSGHHKIFLTILGANFVSMIATFAVFWVVVLCWGLAAMWVTGLRPQ
jgi:hypothetical protein